MAFTAVVSGNPTNAADINALLNWANGSSNNQATITNGTATPLIAQFSSAPGSDTSHYAGQVSADTVARASTYQRGADGYGGFRAGAGPSFTAHFYAQSTGWKIDEALNIVGGLTVGGSTSLAGLNTSGNAGIGGTFNVTGAATLTSTLSVGGTLHVTGLSSLDNGNILSDGSGDLDIAGGLTFGTGNAQITSNSGNLFLEIPGSIGTGQTLFIQYLGGGGSNLVSLYGDSSWCYLDSQRASGIRFREGGSTIAHFAPGATGLIVNTGYTFGSGGADMAERAYTDDTLGAGEVVCFEEDGTHGGKVVRCTHPDCAAAAILSTQPAGLYGGELIWVEEEQQRAVPMLDTEGKQQKDAQGQPLWKLETYLTKEQVFDDSPHWQPVAMIGRVPVKVSGTVSDYHIRQKVVSNGDGTVRPFQPGDENPLGVVCSLLSDVGKRALAPGQVLVLLRR